MNNNESLTNLLEAIVDVKSFAQLAFGVEETRPETCERCGVRAGSCGAKPQLDTGAGLATAAARNVQATALA
ncbi:MAG: hypothetical protein V3V08_06165 [Nannocystaceae bacterium]